MWLEILQTVLLFILVDRLLIDRSRYRWTIENWSDRAAFGSPKTYTICVWLYKDGTRNRRFFYIKFKKWGVIEYSFKRI